MLGAMAGQVHSLLTRRLLQHPNQTDSAAAALNILTFYDGCSNRQLSQGLRLSHTATVRLADKLEEEGLVESRPGQDRRAVVLTLTDAGRARAREILTARCQVLDTVLSPLTEKEQETLSGLLEKLLRHQIKAPEDESLCRLCDSTACPPETCPVHQRALALMPRPGGF
jgi:DNA-binding MarR family transcriptional regulator